jgi:hypothetical protein
MSMAHHGRGAPLASVAFPLSAAAMRVSPESYWD